MPVSVDTLLEKDFLPDWLIRIGIRRLLRERLREEDAGDPARQRDALLRFVGELRASPIAIETKAANDQHYELPAAFFVKCSDPTGNTVAPGGRRTSRRSRTPKTPCSN